MTDLVRTSDRLLKQLLNAAEDTAIAIIDADYRLTWLNRTAERFFRCSAAAVTGQSVRELHIRNRVAEARFEEAVAQIEAGHSFEYRVEQPGEEGIRYLGMRLSGLWQSGRLIGYLLLARDITERYRSELRARKEGEHYRNLYEHAPVPYHSLDARARIRHVNPAWLKAFGYPEEAVIGRPIYDFLDSGQKEIFDRAFERFKRSGKLCGLKLDMRRSDGRRLIASLTGCAIYDERNRFHHTHCILLDITEQERNRRDLELFRFALEKSGDAVFWLTPEAKLLYVNEAACRQLGYTRQELLTKYAWDIDPRLDPSTCREVWDHIKEEGTLRMESVHRRKDGSEFPVEITANHLVYGEEEFNCAVVRDVSEQQRVQKELQQAHKMEALGQLTSGIAHDFNNILASILGFSELSLMQLKSGKTDNLHAHLREINTAGRRGKELIEQMLRFTRNDSHEQKRLQLQPLVKEITRLARSTLPSSILIEQQVEADTPPITADPVQIHQALMNLCVNARDAMENKGVLQIRLGPRRNLEFECDSCRCKLHGDWVELQVEDTGHGIPPEIREQIFDPFFTTKEPGKGTGMGLAVVQGAVHQNHGHIVVESEPGQGTRFRLLFPPAKTETEEEGHPPPHPGGAHPIRQGTALVVDDEPAVLAVMCALLEHEGLSTIAFHDGEEALEHFRQDPGAFDMVLTDQTMPRMTGVELIRRIHELRPELPVILCTGFSDSVSEENAPDFGITAFLRKPVELGTLRQVLAQLAD